MYHCKTVVLHKQTNSSPCFLAVITHNIDNGNITHYDHYNIVADDAIPASWVQAAWNAFLHDGGEVTYTTDDAILAQKIEEV